MKKTDNQHDLKVKALYRRITQYSSLSLFSLMAISVSSFAESYKHCSALEIHHIQAQLNRTRSAETQADFFDCIHLQHSKNILALSSTPTGESTENAGNYDLKLMLLEPKSFQLLDTLQTVQGIIPATRLNDVKFDITHYSKQKDLIGVGIHQSHIGGINSSKRLLNLYAIHTEAKITQVLSELMTDYSSSMSSSCDDWHTVKLNRTVHLNALTRHDYPLFDIKERIAEHTYNTKNCKPIIQKQQKNYQIHFDGVSYPIQHIKINDHEL